jgi:DtxR family Mn-dependent transcriptional regulator
MVDPALALFLFVFLLLAAALFFWPERGLLFRLLRLSGMTERVRLEDSLKHLYKCEYSGRQCSMESLAGAVGVSRSRAVELLARLEELDLARAEQDSFVLTEEGRGYALHIVRTHRLLERYLADRTGVLPQDWHKEAERREHRFTPDDRESLAARLGHPVYDPHGDPIPTSAGDLPPRTGLPLTGLDPGDAASIVHLGDEPREVYDALTKAGLTPSMLVRLLEVGPGEIRFEAGGRELSLPPVIARKITVEPLPDADVEKTPGETLAEVEGGEVVRVIGIHPGLQGPQRRRLLDLGLVPGTLVESELESASGDPVAYRIRGALIALREDQARWIQVDRRVDS